MTVIRQRQPSVFPYVRECIHCNGTGIHMYNPDYPMGDCGAREPEPCIACEERGWLIPNEWIDGSGISASQRADGGSSDHSATRHHGLLNTSAHSKSAGEHSQASTPSAQATAAAAGTPPAWT